MGKKCCLKFKKKGKQCKSCPVVLPKSLEELYLKKKEEIKDKKKKKKKIKIKKKKDKKKEKKKKKVSKKNKKLK